VVKEKENSNPMAATHIRPTTIADFDEPKDEHRITSISSSTTSFKPAPTKSQQPTSMKPQLQDAYNQLQREIAGNKGKNEVVKKRTDSFHCGDKKKANATINPYITQAPAWMEATVGTECLHENDDLLKKIQEKFSVNYEKKKDDGRISNSKERAKANNKSAMNNDEKMHLRSYSHSNCIHKFHRLEVEDKRTTVDNANLASMIRKTNYKVQIFFNALARN